MTEDQMRAEFEAWIASPPYEKPVTICPDGSAWTGQYRAYEVQLAWEAWQASRASLCVELPEPMPNTAGMDMATASSAIGFNRCLAYTRISLNKAGVKYK